MDLRPSVEGASTKLVWDPSLPIASRDIPLVTFSVFSYNQAKFIREAVEGALAQSYSPLEVIISDDCSSDESMQEILEAVGRYRGPHRVLVRFGHKNLGTYNHLLAVAKLASGQLLVVNGGDDRSFPHRAEVLANAFVRSKASALGSRHDEINAAGNQVRHDVRFPESKGAQLVFGKSARANRHNDAVLSIPGFAAAYDTGFLKTLSPASGKLLIEDGTLNGILNCTGGTMHFVDESLIEYRIHAGGLTVRGSNLRSQSLLTREAKISRAGESIVLMMEQIETETLRLVGSIEPSVVKGLRRGKRYGAITRGYWELSPLRRGLLLFRCRSPEDLRFILPRLFGIRVFMLIRQLAQRVSLLNP